MRVSQAIFAVQMAACDWGGSGGRLGQSQPRVPGRIQLGNNRLQIMVGLFGRDTAFDSRQAEQFNSAIEQQHAQGYGIIRTHISIND
jgi:hypothetical protein